jgi:mannose-6-phosphate isomerase-like protein (cupin superfamily)
MSDKIYELLENIRPVSTVHAMGEKQVFLSAADSLSNITQFAYGKFKPGEGSGMHTHFTMEEFFYFLNGYGKCRAGKEHINIYPDMFLRILPNTDHSIENTGDLDLTFIYFGAAVEKI